MNQVKIVNWMMRLDDELFTDMKSILLDKYVILSFVNNKDITKEALCEKIIDHIEKIMFKNTKSFDDLVKYYYDSFDELIDPHLEKEYLGKNSKGKAVYTDSRAIKYFKHAKLKRDDKKHPLIGLEDYSRISLCLYNELFRYRFTKIKDFDFSFKNLNCQAIVSSLESLDLVEKNLFKGEKRTKAFNTEDKFSLDTFVLIMTIMMFYHLKSKEVRSDYQ